MHLYVTEQGTRLNKCGEHLVVQRNGCSIDDVLLSEVDSLSLFGALYPTTDAILALLDRGVEISLLSRGGHFKGRIVPSMGKNVPLRLKQYDAFCNPEISFEIARGCVVRKLRGGLLLLSSYSYNAHNDFCFTERAEFLENLERLRLYTGNDKDVLRGYEGLGAKLYFQAFARCLKHGIGFPGRKYYPSTDPVNALLSFGYSFVARNMESLLESVGIDPAIGFLHEPSYGRASLALDMLEEFRHPFVDRLVLGLFNRRYIVPDDFENRAEEGTSGQLYLKPDAVKVFIRAYEEQCEAPNRTYADYRDLSWRQVFRRRVESLRQSLMKNFPDCGFDWEYMMEDCA